MDLMSGLIYDICFSFTSSPREETKWLTLFFFLPFYPHDSAVVDKVESA